jgi:hypothetical protein
VYKDLGKGILKNAFDGYNSSLFAYGQTGAGKSYTVGGMGTNKGLVPMICEELFEGIKSRREVNKENQFEVETVFSLVN